MTVGNSKLNEILEAKLSAPEPELIPGEVYRIDIPCYRYVFNETKKRFENLDVIHMLHRGSHVLFLKREMVQVRRYPNTPIICALYKGEVVYFIAKPKYLELITFPQNQ